MERQVDMLDAKALSALTNGTAAGNGIGLKDLGSIAQFAAMLMSLVQGARMIPANEPGPAESAGECKEPAPVVPDVAEPVPEPAPKVPEADPVQEPEPELEPEPLQLGRSSSAPPRFKPAAEPSSLFERVRDPAPYSSVSAERAPKRARPDSDDGEDKKHEVGPVNKKPNHFDSYRRSSVGADTCSDAFAPQKQFNLPPVVEMTQEECENMIEDKQRQFRISLAKQDIKRRLTDHGTAELRKAEHKFAIMQIDHESRVTEEAMELLLWAQRMRATARMTSTKQAAGTRSVRR